MWSVLDVEPLESSLQLKSAERVSESPLRVEQQSFCARSAFPEPMQLSSTQRQWFLMGMLSWVSFATLATLASSQKLCSVLVLL